MPTQFETLLNQLNSGGKIPPGPALRPAEPAFRISKFDFRPYIFVTSGVETVYPRTKVKSQVGSVLIPQVAAKDYDASFAEVVNLALSLKFLRQYFIMGFVDQAGQLISPENVVSRADPHGVGAGGGLGGDLPDTPKGLENGVWHHVPTATEFIINDAKYHSGAPGAEAVADAPILALGNNLHRVLAVSPDTDAWYEDYPPPAAPRNPAQNNAYVRQLRSYLKKMAIQLVERDDWLLLWHGYLYSHGQGLNFKDIFTHSAILGRNVFKWSPEVTITELDANNGSHELHRYKWRDLPTLDNSRGAGGYGGGGAYRSFYQHFYDIGQLLKTRFGKVILPESRGRDLTLTGDLLHALVEGRLDESLTYNQMLTATAQYWQTRLKTVRNVHTKPPGLVMLKDGTVDLSFDFVSVPSTEGRPHQGYVKFIPERGQPNLIDKLKDFLGRIGQQVKRFIGKKVPPRALKGSDLRKMLCEVSCDCKDFKYRMSYANVKQGVTTQAGRTDNGRAPVKTNPARRPGFCKHILATLRYLTDDAEIQISKDLSLQQQEALKKDRAQFYREAEVSYKQMKAPAAKGAEEIEPEEEPISPEFAKLPAPPKPELAPPPLMAPTAPTPPTPNYQSTQL
jgi:hypothetical protein